MNIPDVREKLAFLDEYKRHPDKYLPLIDHAWQVFPERDDEGCLNLGWNVGVICNNRPYFSECWAQGFTATTVFISTKGIENWTVEQLEQLLELYRIEWYVGERKYKTIVEKFVDGNNNEFFSINYVVGVDDEEVYTSGGIHYSMKWLNDYNSQE